MKILSLGWGVQSWTLAAMSALGYIEKFDYAIHADTLHESHLTYVFAKQWTKWLEDRGIKVVTVSTDFQDGTADKWGGVFIPAFTYSKKGNGMLRRQCTQRWKIAPIKRWLQANRNKEQVTQFLGISTDEALRMKPSSVKYIVHKFPLIDMEMSRKDCKQWLTDHDLPIAPRSSCTFCPFHSTKEWRLRKSIPQDWEKAVAVDKSIRDIRPPFPLFVHPARIPLADVDLRTQEEKGQMSLWDEECAGICGV
jgi:hypothetical protein